MKKCSKCKELKPLDSFNKDSQKIDKKQSHCRLCNSHKCNSWRHDNPDKFKLSVDNWKDNNKGYWVEWNQLNPHYNTLWFRKEIKTNPTFKLSSNIRSLIGMSFKNVLNNTYKKGKKTEEILGCTLEEFINYLQSLFIEGMTLENHGEWEMDHIIPISSAKTEEEIYKLNHYTNFQPLWKEDNRKKSNKMLGY